LPVSEVRYALTAAVLEDLRLHAGGGRRLAPFLGRGDSLVGGGGNLGDATLTFLSADSKPRKSRTA